ncbi:hypothetical protein Mmar10_1480 [Maricaulis maris MCS10]|jgi:hypothetical protein|uniref:Lipoprotein n=2 Tax=Maricaulis maris TaxID=74318 RepID=Q0APL5_MARMM|nr:hypothetical protein Mmar10_1480 [Maricaulis maris MCS10]
MYFKVVGMINSLAMFALTVACASDGAAVGIGAATSRSPAPDSLEVPMAVDLTVTGTVRARGIFGFASVRGVLSLGDGMLSWVVNDSRECGAYVLTSEEGQVRFSARYLIDNQEQVDWTGVIDGESVSDVRIVWTRVEGDFIHDLFLPEQVTLEFTPDRG